MHQIMLISEHKHSSRLSNSIDTKYLQFKESISKVFTGNCIFLAK